MPADLRPGWRNGAEGGTQAFHVLVTPGIEGVREGGLLRKLRLAPSAGQAEIGAEQQVGWRCGAPAGQDEHQTFQQFLSGCGRHGFAGKLHFREWLPDLRSPPRVAQRG